MAQASSARRNGCRLAILGAALAAAAGCTGKGKPDGMRTLDPGVKAALTGPTSKDSPKPKFAITDPNATGAKDLTVKSSFDRKLPNNPLTPIEPLNNGSLASNSGPVPTQPTTGGLLVPQKPLEQVKYEAPPVMPLDGPLPKPVMPLDNPTPSEVPAPTPPPQPIMPALTAPGAFPPANSTALPIIPEAGTVTLPSPNEKPIFPVTPPAIK